MYARPGSGRRSSTAASRATDRISRTRTARRVVVRRCLIGVRMLDRPRTEACLDLAVDPEHRGDGLLDEVVATPRGGDLGEHFDVDLGAKREGQSLAVSYTHLTLP